jgi:hypothetical protein
VRGRTSEIRYGSLILRLLSTVDHFAFILKGVGRLAEGHEIAGVNYFALMIPDLSSLCTHSSKGRLITEYNHSD